MSCNFGLKSYLWFQIELALRSFDFEITRMISDQIALHSVQLPLLIKSNTALRTLLFLPKFKSGFKNPLSVRKTSMKNRKGWYSALERLESQKINGAQSAGRKVKQRTIKINPTVLANFLSRATTASISAPCWCTARLWRLFAMKIPI